MTTSSAEQIRREAIYKRFPTLEKHLRCAHALCDLENDELNAWQAKFVDSVTRLMESGYAMSPRQERKLWEIRADTRER